MPPTRRRRRRFPVYQVLRATVGVLALAGVVVVFGYCAALLLIDPNGYKPEIEAAVKQATGRTLALRGPMRLTFGLPPWLVAENVTFSNPGGASRQEMVTLDRAEARIAVFPLLSGNINLTELTLIRPDVRLERDVNGRPNWLIARAVPELAPANAAQPAESTDQGGQQGSAPPVSRLAMGQPTRSRVAVQSLHIEGGRIGWLPRPGALVAEVTVPRLDATASGPNGTMLLNGSVVAGGRTLALTGDIGSLGRLFDANSPVAWPVRAQLQDPQARLQVNGEIAQPMRGRGLSLQIEAAVVDFSGIEPFLGNWPIPHDATLAMHLGDGSLDGGDGLTSLDLHLGHVVPTRLLPGITIDHADLAAHGLEQPVHFDAEGSSGIGDMKLVANVGSFAALLPGPHPDKPVPVDVTLDAGRAFFSAKGTVLDPRTLKGLDVDLFARVPDLAAFSQLVGRRLPPLSEVAFEGHAFGDMGAIGLRKATLTLPQAQLSGDTDVRFGGRPFVHAALTSQRIDLDALLENFSQPWGATGPAAEPAPAQAAAPAPAEPAPAPVPARLIPDKPIDLSPLDLLDADVQLRVDSLQYGGITYSQVAGNLMLRDGKATLDPLVGVTPGGPVELQLSVDSRAPGTPVSLMLRAPSLRMAPIASALGLPATAANGSITVDADLQGAGRTLHAIAGSLSGRLGVQSVDAEFDNRLLLGLLRSVKLPEAPLGSGGSTRLRCLAVRLDASKGIVTVGALVADLQRVVVMAGGTLDLGQEQFDLEVRPTLRVGGAIGGVVVPVRVSGGFLDPRVTSDVGGKGGASITGKGAPDPCGPALAAAAAVPPKPKPTADASVGKPEKSGPASAIDVLKDLIK